ncbi:MAG: ATP-binding protein [Sphaerochaetaceae bacterium]
MATQAKVIIKGENNLTKAVKSASDFLSLGGNDSQFAAMAIKMAEIAARKKEERSSLLLSRARLTEGECYIGQVEMPEIRKLDMEMVKELNSLHFIGEHRNLIIWGPPGTGKSWLGSMIATSACKAGIRTRWVGFPQLLRELAALKRTGWELYSSGKSQRKIAKDLGISRESVAKYLAMTDFNEVVAPKWNKGKSKLDPYKPLIRDLLGKEEGVFRKQRWTAVRIQSYLVGECGYTVLGDSYHLIRRYMKSCRQEMARESKAAGGTMELVWHAGEAQADSGEADFNEGGVQKREKYLIISFPHSNKCVAVLLPGENGKCVCQGLQLHF